MRELFDLVSYRMGHSGCLDLYAVSYCPVPFVDVLFYLKDEIFGYKNKHSREQCKLRLSNESVDKWHIRHVASPLYSNARIHISGDASFRDVNISSFNVLQTVCLLHTLRVYPNKRESYKAASQFA